jgi:hypothetical protein
MMSQSNPYGMMMRCLLAAAGTAAMMLAAAAWAVDPLQVDDFEDGTTMGWEEGAPSPNPPVNVPDGGPGGAGDAYLENASSGGTGAGSRMVMFNNAQWTGDYVAAGVVALQADLINLGASDLPMRVAVEGAGGGRYASVDPVVLPAGSGWLLVVFDLTDAGMVQVGGAQTLAEVLASVTELRVLASNVPDWNGAALVATVGMDNLASGSSVFTDGFESGTTAAWSLTVP